MTHANRWSGLVVLAGVLTLGASTVPAQTLVGNWAPINHEDAAERGAGPALVDYSGLPLTEAGRQRGLTWDAALLTMPEHQCKPHPSTYGYRGIGGPRIDRIVDPKNFSVIALTMHIPWMEQRRIVWLDGRPHPPEYAAHTWQGFSTGRWEGETLVVDTTHLKAGMDPPQRAGTERQGHHARVLHPPRQHADAHLRDLRPVLPVGADDQDQRLPAGQQRQPGALPVPGGRRSGSASRRRAELSPGQESVPGRVREALQPPAQGRAGRSRDRAAGVRPRHRHVGVDDAEAGTGR